MAKLTLSDLSTLTNDSSAVTAINANSTLIETALENTLSRDGTSPNAMNANLDMNSNRILNLPTPTNDTDVVTKLYGDENYGGAAVTLAEGFADDAEASAAAALVSENAASASEIAAQTAETNAETAETGAVAAQAAAEAAAASLSIPTAEIADAGKALVGAAGGGYELTADVLGTAAYESGTAAAEDIGTSGATVPLLNGANTWGAEQNLADELLTRPKLKDYAETVNAIGSIGGGTQDIDLTLGNYVTGTVDTSETTFTFSNPSPTANCCSFTLELLNGGSQTVNWPGAVDWGDADAPTLTAAGTDILVFATRDAGTTWRGFLAGTGF